MAKNSALVDSHTIQHTLAILEERYQQLREIGEKHVLSWQTEKAQLQQQLSAQAEALEQALASGEEQARTIERQRSEQEALQQEHAAQAEALEQALASGEEQASRLEALGSELDALRRQHDHLLSSREAAEQQIRRLQQRLSAQTEALQRLRQLAVPPASLQR